MGLAVGLGVQVNVAARVGADVRVPVPRTPLRGVASCTGSTCGEGTLVVVAVGVNVRVGWSVSAGTSVCVARGGARVGRARVGASLGAPQFVRMTSTGRMTNHGRPIFIPLPRVDPTESFFKCLFCLARLHQDVQAALDGVPPPAALGAEKYENAGPLLTRNLK